jgi:short-subunit dehydrogenase
MNAAMNEALLDGKIALVLGASRGIGAAAARLFAREGATVVLAARTQEALRSIADEITADGGKASHVVADLGDAAGFEIVEVERLKAGTMERIHAVRPT